jgi:thioredoxin-related protein
MNSLKKLVLPLLCLLIGFKSKSQGINFEKNLNWTQIQAKAKTENKYIFVDTYATWCGPCKAMSAEIFTRKEIGDFINDKFICVKVQMDQTKSDDEFIKNWYADAKSIDRQYKVTAYPTILFFSPEGKPAGRSIGYKDADGLIAEAKKAIANSEEFATFYEQYNSGKRDSGFVKELAMLGRKIGQSTISEKIAQQYIRGLNDQELFKKDNLQFINQFTTCSNDKGFNLFRKESKKVNAILGKNVAEIKVREIIGKEEIESFKGSKSIPDWSAIENSVTNKYGAIGLESYYEGRMGSALEKKDWVNFGKYYALYYATAYSRSKFHINNISWTIFERISDPKVLDVAVKTMKYDLEHFDQNDAVSYDTYANLLYKAGKKQEAILWESKALRLEEENTSKNNGKPNPVFAETLEKMKAGVPTWPLVEPKKQ